MQLQDSEGEAEKHANLRLPHNFLFYTSTVRSGHDLARAVEVRAPLIYSAPHWRVNLGSGVRLNAGTQTPLCFPSAEIFSVDLDYKVVIRKSLVLLGLTNKDNIVIQAIIITCPLLMQESM